VNHEGRALLELVVLEEAPSERRRSLGLRSGDRQLWGEARLENDTGLLQRHAEAAEPAAQVAAKVEQAEMKARRRLNAHGSGHFAAAART
jgi:hypothetical protein